MVSNLVFASVPFEARSTHKREQETPWAEHQEVLDALHRGFWETHDPGLQERLLMEYRGLARHYAKRFTGGGEPLDDLEQVAMLAVLRALNRFDPDRGVKFTTYAGRVISGELKRHLRDHTWPMRVPRPLQELYLQARSAVSILEVERGHSPTVAEVAEFLGSSEEDVLEAMEVSGAFRLPSLDSPAMDTSGGLAARVGREDPHLLEAYERLWREQLLKELRVRLNPADRELLEMYFVGNMSQSEIGARIGVSQVGVSRRLRRILDHLSALAQAIQAEPVGAGS